MYPERKVTFVLTSCGRLDLLKRTLESFVAHNNYPIEHYIIIEDSGSEAVRGVVEEVLGGGQVSGKVEVIINEKRLGQDASIDAAYTHVKTPYIFHCEDDWLFCRSNIIEDSFPFLEQFSEVVQVHSRNLSDEPTLAKFIKGEGEVLDGISYYDMNPKWHPEYFGFSFNPGLRRLSDYRTLMMPYSENGPEMRLSLLAKSLGMRMIVLKEGGVAHNGDDRHIDDPMVSKRVKNRFGRLKNSIKKRRDRIRRKITGRI